MGWWQWIWERIEDQPFDVLVLIGLVVIFVRLEQTVRSHSVWITAHDKDDKDWKQNHGDRLVRVEADYDHVIRKCPEMREARLARERIGAGEDG